MSSTYTPNFKIEMPARGDYPNDWDIPVNFDWSVIDSCLGGVATIDMSGGSVAIATPTPGTVSGNQYVKFTLTGALSGNVTLTFPAVGGFYVVDNQTSGAHTVTVLTAAAGSTGVVVTQGVRSALISDATNFYFADDRVTNQASFGVVQSIAAATTTDLGTVSTRNANITGSGVSITSFGTSAPALLPVYLVVFSGSNTLVYNATSMILPGGANITTNAGDSLIAVEQSYGSGNWQIISYTHFQTVAATIAATNHLTIQNNAATPNSKMDVVAMNAILTGAGYLQLTTGAITVTINSTIVGANGLDTGVVAPNTWYNMFLISDGTTTAGLFSISVMSPTLPSGYKYVGYIGSVKTDASGNFYRVLQKGAKSQYVVTPGTNTASLPNMTTANQNPGGAPNATTATYTAFSVTSYVSPIATEIYGVVNGNTSITVVAPNPYYGGAYATSAGNPPPIATLYGQYDIRPFVMSLESTNLYWATYGASGGVLCMGWINPTMAC